MKLTFLGAAREVTGSCYLLEVNGKSMLVDCGMAQGPDIYENQHISVNPSKLSAVFLTHAHIDHSGLLPMLSQNGFKGKIYLTRPSRDLACIMLKDSAHIQESEAEWRNRKAKRARIDLYKPLYTSDDVLATIKLFKACEYEEVIEVLPGVKVSFFDAGHLLGSSSILFDCVENGEERKIVFSGDIGNSNKPILKDPTYLTQADYVIMESTYGDRSHEAESNHVKELTEIIQRTLDRGGNLVIPSFAIGRMQEMLYYLHEIKSKGLVYGHDDFPVYVDSPLAVEATKIFNKPYDCFDEKMTEMIKQGINPLDFKDLHLSVSVEDSKSINNDPTPKIILSASGMCEAGRIRHHLKYNLWREECTVVFVGYQVAGTLGRILLDGVKNVNILGETIAVAAEITKLNSTSSHADNNGLIKWITEYVPKPSQVFVTHGTDTVAPFFAERLSNEFGVNATAPMLNAEWDLVNNICLCEGAPRKESKSSKSSTTFPKSGAFMRLENAGQALMDVIRGNEGGTNYDLKRFAEELEKLCKRWKRQK